MTLDQKQKICETCDIYLRQFICPANSNQAQPWLSDWCPKAKWNPAPAPDAATTRCIKLLTYPDRKTGNHKIDDILTQYAIALEEAETSDKGCTPCKKGALIREYMQKLKLAGV